MDHPRERICLSGAALVRDSHRDCGPGYPGYQGAHLLRRDHESEVEFVTILWFESLDAVIAFAGEDHEAAVVLPKARALLSHFDARSTHYETLLSPS